MKRSESITDLGRSTIGERRKSKNMDSLSRKRDVLNSLGSLDIMDERESTGRRLEKRKTWSKSLKVDSADSSDSSIVEEKIKKDNNLISTEGYVIESILDDPVDEDFKTKDDDDNDIYYEQLLENFYNSPEDVVHYVYSADDILVVSVSLTKEDVNQVIITTQNGDKIMNTFGLHMKSKTLKNLKKEQKFLSYIDPRLTKKKTRRIKSNSTIMGGFLTLAKLDPGYLHTNKKFKVGVIYWNGSMKDQDTLSIDTCTDEFEKFLFTLGDEVTLLNFRGYNGGLDNNKNQDGKSSIHTIWEGNEIMFHVAPLMKGGSHQKKVHIGNDAVVVVFIDSDELFSPEFIQTTFNQVYILVYLEHDVSKKKSTKKNKKSSNKNHRSQPIVDPFSIDEDVLLLEDKPIQSRKRNSVKNHKNKHSDRKSDSDQSSTTSQKASTHLTSERTYYRISVLRRDGVPAFGPKLTWPSPVYREGKAFRTFMLSKIISANKASYLSQSYQEKVQKNRKQFLENFIKDWACT